MLFCMRWEINAVAESVLTEGKASSTGDSNSLVSRTFRRTETKGVIGRGNSPSVVHSLDGFVIPKNQPRTENLNHDLSTSFPIVPFSANFSFGKNSNPFLPSEMEVAIPALQLANSSFVGQLSKNH